MINLQPAANDLSTLLVSLDDDELGWSTPCPGSSVGALIDHIGTFAVRFTEAARKTVTEPMAPPPDPSAAHLEPGWRERLRRDLANLASAWSDPSAWTGTTFAGGLELPAEVVGLVAIDELVVHGWDLAVATDRQFQPRTIDVQAAMEFVHSFEAPRDGTLFGAIVEVSPEASPLEQLLGLTGRDPRWLPPGRPRRTSPRR